MNPFKFETGQMVLIGKTKFNDPSMLEMEGQIKPILNRGYIEWKKSGHENFYRIDDFFFEEDCLTLAEETVEIDNVTDNEVNDILQG